MAGRTVSVFPIYCGVKSTRIALLAEENCINEATQFGHELGIVT